jgi:hypothetical protein
MRTNLKREAWLRDNRDKHRCECGCGQFVQPNIYRWYQDRSLRFLLHHQSRGVHHGHYKGGKVVAKGYVWILSPKHPRRTRRNYVKRCWLVMEAHLGRALLPGELIHHKNGVKTDDCLENLEVSERVQHGRMHNTGAENAAWRHDVTCVAIAALISQGWSRRRIAEYFKCGPSVIRRRLAVDFASHHEGA